MHDLPVTTYSQKAQRYFFLKPQALLSELCINRGQRSCIWQPGAEFLYILDLSECFIFMRHLSSHQWYVKLQLYLQSYCSEQLSLHLLEGALHREFALAIKNFPMLETDRSPGQFSNPSHVFSGYHKCLFKAQTHQET